MVKNKLFNTYDQFEFLDDYINHDKSEENENQHNLNEEGLAKL